MNRRRFDFDSRTSHIVAGVWLAVIFGSLGYVLAFG